MKKNALSIIGLCLVFAVPALVCGCVRMSGESAASGVSESAAVVTLAPVEAADAQTKAVSSDFEFSFASGDKIKVYPNPKGSAVLTYSLNPDASNARQAALDVQGVKMPDGDYCVVYPPVGEDYTMTLAFDAQTQDSNGSAAHLAKVDYCWADAQVIDNQGAFTLAHKVAFVKMTVSPGSSSKLTFKAITVEADEGVAASAGMDAITGEVIPSRKAGDKLTLSLGNQGQGIQINENGTLTAFIAIPAGKYTNLCFSTTDNNGVGYVMKTRKESEIKAGKYYEAVLAVPGDEDNAFTRKTVYGIYSGTPSSPSAVQVYTKGSDQISYGIKGDIRNFKLFNPATGLLARFTLPLGLEIQEDYTVSYQNGTGSTVSGTFTVVKLTDTCVWLEDKANHKGYILAIKK